MVRPTARRIRGAASYRHLPGDAQRMDSVCGSNRDALWDVARCHRCDLLVGHVCLQPRLYRGPPADLSRHGHTPDDLDGHPLVATVSPIKIFSRFIRPRPVAARISHHHALDLARIHPLCVGHARA